LRGIRFVQYGLGPIGCGIARLAIGRGLELVGALDIAEEKVGRDIGELLGLAPVGVRVVDDASSLLSSVQGDIVLHSTTSYLSDVYPQVSLALENGLDIISTAEELSYPWAANPRLAEELDDLARRRGATALGAGVNPGFVMDLLPLVLTAPCQAVQRVFVRRVVDASRRRLPLQRKIGVGISAEEFRERVARGGFGHVGLRESLRMVSEALGLGVEEVREVIEPVVAERPLATPFLQVAPGRVAGLRQVCRGLGAAGELIALELQMYVGAQEPHDYILVEGTPRLETIVKGGVPGDEATAAMVVNYVPRVIAASPGLVTVRDLPVPHGFVGM